MIAAFLTWWGEQLAGLLPAWLQADTGGGDALIAAISEDGFSRFTISLRANGREAQLGSYPLDPEGLDRLRSALPSPRPATTLLRVPPDFLLERQINLPLAVEAKWRNVLGFEMNRLTPFSAEQLFWDAAIERRDPVRGLKIRLWMIPKARIMPAIGSLGEAGLTPAAIEISQNAGEWRRIGLIDRQAGGQWRTSRLLDLACAALVMIAVTLPFVMQWQRGLALSHQIARLQPELTQFEALRQRGVANAAGAGVLSDARAKIGNPLAVLDAVTRALPDNSYATELTLNHLQLTITGESGSAAALLPALSAYSSLANIAFAAPVSRDSASHRDLFSIQAQTLPQ